MTSLFTRLRSRFPEPERPFATLEGGRWYRYRDVADVSARFANRLVRLGVRPGDRVAVQADKSVEGLMLYLATLRAGAVYLPLNTAYTPGELGYFLNDAEPTVFVCDPGKADALRPVAQSAGATLETMGDDPFAEDAGTMLEGGLDEPTEFDDIERADDDLAAILYTSGTTGRSKGAMLSHANLWSNAEALVEAWRFTPDDLLIHALPTYHTHGLFVATHCVLASGAAMHVLPRYDPERIVELMRDGSERFVGGEVASRRPSVLMGVPTHYVRLLQQEGLSEAARDMRLFTSGSAPLLAETHRAFEAATGQRILERYGMTETNMNTSNPYEGDRRAGTVGMPLPGVELRLTADGKPVAPGEVGAIEVRGPNVFRGYWRMPDKTADEFRGGGPGGGWFVTGDLGRLSEDGYLTIVGREKDLVISGGLNVYPAEVEDAIDRLPGVAESAVIGLPHPDLGEGVTAVVVRSDPAPGEKELGEADVIAGVRGVLAGFKRPKRVLFADALPRNAMGKVLKAQLRRDHAALYAD